MPIEIRELSIKTFVNETPPQTPEGNTGSAGAGKLSQSDKDCIISACVEQVVQILKDREER